jgi:putative ABC transport system permease protein
MVSIGKGAQEEILATIESMGADVVHVRAKPVTETKIGELVNDSQGLNRNDLGTVRNVIRGSGAMTFRVRMDPGVSDLSVPLAGINTLAVGPGIFEVHNLEAARGRRLLALDHQNYHRVTVLGSELAKRAFPEGALGKVFRLDYTYFTVVGVLQKRSTVGEVPVDPEVYNQAVIIPYQTATEELRPPRVYNEIDLVSIRVENTADTLAAKRVLIPTIRALHGGLEDFEVVAPEEILRQRQAAQAVLNIVLISIAAISLLVGGIGVMNIMLANIMERVTEIGLRRALGARRQDIRNQFLTEAVLICFVGGIIGIVLGTLISFTVAWSVDLPIAFAWKSMLISFAVSAFIGVTFGLVPAMRAADTNPIEALQHE